MERMEIELDEFKVAETFYALPPEQRDYRELAKQLFPTSWKSENFDMRKWENRLGKTMRGLERRGMIHHRVLRGDSKFLPRNAELEDEMRHTFPVRQVVVVDITSLGQPAGTPASQGEAWNRYDDAIHKRLGAWGGRLLMSCLRPGDHIGTGGGRGSHFAVERCRVGLGTRYLGNMVTLTGRISTHAWDPRTENSYLDADNVATTLHGKLGTSGKVESENCAITAECPLPDTEHVTVGVIGIGALGGEHRLKRFEHLDDVKRARAELREVNRLAEAIEGGCESKEPPFYHPVGDVCNWYYVVEGAGRNGMGKERKNLEKAVAELNAKFMNAKPSTLAGIARRGMVVAVAGGPHKAAAIRHVLRAEQEGPWITHLVTDHRTAGWILEKERVS